MPANLNDQGLSRLVAARFVTIGILSAALLFFTAGSIRYWQGWVLLAIQWGGMTWIIRYFLRHDPALLARRLQHRIAGEKTALQKALQISGQLCFLGTLLVACLDHRFGWSHLPVPLVVAGELLVACCLGGMFLVFRENTYASVLIEVAPRQTVVSTGPYRIVRHPVYAVGLLFIGGMPLALGSAWALLFLLPVAAVLLVRLTDEEKFLVEHLPGYAEYRTHTRFRLIPGIF